jgi:hypothetical protein
MRIFFIFFTIVNIAELYPEELHEQIRYTSELFRVSCKVTGEWGRGRKTLFYLGLIGYYSNGKPDTFYITEEDWKYQRMPKSEYYIFDYVYDTTPDSGSGSEFIKVIKEVRAFDNNELLDNLENIPYTSPQFQILNVIEHNIFFEGLTISYIRVDVKYFFGEIDSFYTKAFTYKNLPINEYYMFDYIYDTIFEDSLELYGIKDNLVNVKVITDIRSGLDAWDVFLPP